MSTLVEIKPLNGRQRAVATIRTPKSLALHLYWLVDGPVAPNDYHPVHGNMLRAVAYLTPTERRALAAELLEGLE